MIETLQALSPARLRHDHLTPVNHIIGYSELLIEDAGERRLEPFIPVLQGIHESGRELMELIQGAFSEHADPARVPTGDVFRAKLHAAALEMSRTLTSLVEDLECSHRQTLADLDAISWAIRRLLEFAGQEAEISDTRQLKPAHRREELRCGVAPVQATKPGGKILIADDDAANRHLLRRRLECDGHEVVEAKNGLEVFESLKDSSCDLVLLDIIMPVMDGFQTLAKLKQDARLRELPVIMISVLDEIESVVRCIEMGADDYLSKPFNRVLLQARIGASLEKKWLRDRERQKADELQQTLQLLEQAQEQLALQASCDTLTGLANRRILQAHFDVCASRGTPFTVIYIDLNDFKRINDTFGHSAGDELLKQVGQRLRMTSRSSDIIGRWGGDEFVAVVDVDSDVEAKVSRIMECLTGDFVINDGSAQRRVTVGASVGAAAWKPGDTTTDVLHRADFAMYEKKLLKRRLERASTAA